MKSLPKPKFDTMATPVVMKGLLVINWVARKSAPNFPEIYVREFQSRGSEVCTFFVEVEGLVLQ